MKIENYQFPKSSFLSIEKDLGIITNIILKNDRLKRLLYYTTPDALDRPKLTEDQSLELFEKNIKIIPKLSINQDKLNYIVISFDNFAPNANNPEFRNNIISFDILCHFDQWQLKGDFQLRPYKIAAELDYMLAGKRLTGIGKLEFMGCNQLLIDDEIAGISLNYLTIHGEEDKKDMPNPMDEAKFLEDFNNTFNSDV